MPHDHIGPSYKKYKLSGRTGILAKVFLGAPHGVMGLAGALCPTVAIGVKRDPFNAQALAPLFELGCAVAGADGAKVGEQRPLAGRRLSTSSIFGPL